MIKILFICHGNICRSPMSEFILKDMVEKRGIQDHHAPEQDLHDGRCQCMGQEGDHAVDAVFEGLAEGLALDTESKEGKLIAAIIDVLDDMSGKFEDLEDELCDVEDGLDAVSDDLCEVEEALYELEDDDDEYDEDEDDDVEYFETTCPVCEEEIVFDEDTLESGEIRCPNCGEKLEFDLSDLADAEDEDQE